ncbi:MAG: hypothetical protein QN120_02505 [Armatimonadota bacterium]|nr:hypothetical protein [Armatimonadota bacterium]
MVPAAAHLRRQQLLAVSLVVMALGWALALRALALLHAWAPAAGLGFLALVGWGVVRLARI